jgi:hypothetical protein
MDLVCEAYAYLFPHGLGHDPYMQEYVSLPMFDTIKARRNESGGQADATTHRG